MKKQSVVGFAFIALACALVAFACSSLGESVGSFVGKAVWYLPYAALVIGVRLLAVRQ